MLSSEKLAYICSPCHAGTKQGIRQNMLAARKYCEIAADCMNIKAIAPHAWLPEMLDDLIPEQRELAIGFGCDLLSLCDIVLVCGNRLSSGMINEIKLAASLKMPILVFSDNIREEVMTLSQGLSTAFPGRFISAGIGCLATACEDVVQAYRGLCERSGTVGSFMTETWKAHIFKRET